MKRLAGYDINSLSGAVGFSKIPEIGDCFTTLPPESMKDARAYTQPPQTRGSSLVAILEPNKRYGPIRELRLVMIPERKEAFNKSKKKKNPESPGICERIDFPKDPTELNQSKAATSSQGTSFISQLLTRPVWVNLCVKKSKKRRPDNFVNKKLITPGPMRKAVIYENDPPSSTAV
jgi:hypothetical protein